MLSACAVTSVILDTLSRFSRAFVPSNTLSLCHALEEFCLSLTRFSRAQTAMFSTTWPPWEKVSGKYLQETAFARAFAETGLGKTRT